MSRWFPLKTNFVAKEDESRRRLDSKSFLANGYIEIMRIK